MKNKLKFGLAAFILMSSGVVVYAHGPEHHHDHGAAKPTHESMAAGEMAEGEVRRVNLSTGKITLKHGNIPSIQMPPMTMVFGVAEKTMLDGLKQGDKVKFNVKQEGSNYVVTEIQKTQ